MIRNTVIGQFLAASHDLVLWLDADVVAYPPDLIKRLHDANPGGVTAPMVYIEGSDDEAYHLRLCRRRICGGRRQTERHLQLYDRAAFMVTGTNVSNDKSFPGNAQAFPPYFGPAAEAALASASGILECESVGTVYLLPASVYRPPARGEGAAGDDSSSSSSVFHFPTAFTEVGAHGRLPCLAGCCGCSRCSAQNF
eukprot:SAG22_NODE_2060_length_3063_cov_1.479757_2_plen_196_part_00